MRLKNQFEVRGKYDKIDMVYAKDRRNEDVEAVYSRLLYP